MSRLLMFLALVLGSVPAFAAETADKCAQKTGVLFAAYVGVWVVTLIFVIRTGLKAANTASEIERLEQELKELEKGV